MCSLAPKPRAPPSSPRSPIPRSGVQGRRLIFEHQSVRARLFRMFSLVQTAESLSRNVPTAPTSPALLLRPRREAPQPDTGLVRRFHRSTGAGRCCTIGVSAAGSCCVISAPFRGLVFRRGQGRTDPLACQLARDPRRATLVRPSAARAPHRPPASRSAPRPTAPRLPQASPRPQSIDAFPYFTHSEPVCRLGNFQQFERAAYTEQRSAPSGVCAGTHRRRAQVIIS